MTQYLSDMHIHTIYSDGSDTPEQIIEKAREKNIRTLAITDHDVIEGSKQLIALKPKDLIIYSGVELTIKVPHGRMHMLGFNIDLENERLNAELAKIREISIYNVLLYIEIIKRDFNLPIPQERIDALISLPGNIGRPQIAKMLVELGICKNPNEAFDKYLIYAYEKASKVKHGITPEEGIHLIKDAKGVPVLAHPSTLKLSKEDLDKTVAELKSYGLEGIEKNHINEKPEARDYTQYLAEKYDLLISGGTDYHGPEQKPDVELGTGRDGNVYIPDGSLTLTKKIKSRYM